MGEKINPPFPGSFTQSRLSARASARGIAARGKKATQEVPKPATSRRKAADTPKGRRKSQSPAQRAASLRNLALARAARGT